MSNKIDQAKPITPKQVKQTSKKQQYLRENIPANKYDDFGQFCQSIAGNLNIQNWSLDYVQELVQKFKQNQIEKTNNKKRQHQSFHMYQTGNANDIKNLQQQLKKEKLNQGSQSSPSKAKNSAKIQKPLPKAKEQKSAMQVLNSIFQNPNPAQFQTKKYDKKVFQSSNFWAVPKVQEQIKMQSQTSFQSNSLSQGNSKHQQQSFDKIFETGNQNSVKNKNAEQLTSIGNKSNVQQKAKMEKKQLRFEQIVMDDQRATQNKKGQRIQQKQIAVNSNQIQTNIKIVSIKNIGSNKLPYSGQILIKQSFRTKIPCYKNIERQALSYKDLRVTIENHQVINRSFFSSNYVMYHLKVMPTHILCKRNLEDFQKLRKSIEKTYPGFRLPYLHKVGWLQNQTDPQFITYQKKVLTFFLEDLLTHSQLRNSRILQDFLNIKDHKIMKRKFQQIESVQPISCLQQMCLLSGETSIEITQQKRQYNQLMSGLIEKINNYFSESQSILKNIDSLHVSLMNNYKKINEITKQIDLDVKQFNKRVKSNELYCLQQALQHMMSYTQQCTNLNVGQSNFLQINILPLIGYQKNNMSVLKELIDVQQNFLKQYLRSNLNDRQADKTQYLSERFKEYKTNIIQPSSNLTVLKYQCGYINHMTATQGFHYFQILSNQIKATISDVCYSKLKKVSQSVNNLTQLVSA